MARQLRIGITMGDPAGIGPEIVCRAIADLTPEQRRGIVVFASTAVMQRANALVGAGLSFVKSDSDTDDGSVAIVPVSVPSREPVRDGVMSAAAGANSYAYIERAVSAALSGDISVIVTAPINKGALHAAGYPFEGHTELLAHLTGAKSSFMLLASEMLSAIHVSTHVSLAGAVQRATVERELETIRVGNQHLKRMGLARPRVAVAGLNPHCGENGLFGTDEIERINPAIALARQEGIDVTGPVSGDTVFYRTINGEFDLVVAQYHDQGHIPAKLVAFDTTINVTLGLPILRVSVDHGTAFEHRVERCCASHKHEGDNRIRPHDRGFLVSESGSVQPIGRELSRHGLDVAIIADDLTGALDAAAPFASFGFKTRVMLDADRAALAGSRDLEVLSLTTESRHLAGSAAERCVDRAVAAAQANAPSIIFKKIDSTLRGNIDIEIITALRKSGRRHALITPAVPNQGRIMRGGELLVNGRPLRHADVGSDVLPPPHDPLPSFLGSRIPGLSVHCWARGVLPKLDAEPGLHAYVADCESTVEIERLAQFILDHSHEVLPVGALGLAAALARRLAMTRARVWSSSKLRPSRGPLLFIVGSRTRTSIEQTRRLIEAGARDFVVPLSAGKHKLESFLDRKLSDLEPSCPALIVRPGEPQILSEAPPYEVAQELGQAAASLVHRMAATILIMVGGDTAAACLAACAVREVNVLEEFMPGIAAGIMQFDGRPVSFLTKSGGFGGKNTFVQIMRRLSIRSA